MFRLRVPQKSFWSYLNVAFQNALKRIGMRPEVSLVFVMVPFQACLIPNAATVAHTANSCDDMDEFTQWQFVFYRRRFNYLIHIHHAGFQHVLVQKVTESVSWLKYPNLYFLGKWILLQQIKKKSYSLWIQVCKLSLRYSFLLLPRIWHCAVQAMWPSLWGLRQTWIWSGASLTVSVLVHASVWVFCDLKYPTLGCEAPS